jgi:type III pantothenate kinase
MKNSSFVRSAAKNNCELLLNPMNIAIDIGNTQLKCGFFGEKKMYFSELLPKRRGITKNFFRRSLWWNSLSLKDHSKPLSWWIAQTGDFSWETLQAEIIKIRPHDKFTIITHKQIPLQIDVDFPKKVGIDRLLAAFAAVKMYCDAPMLIVDAGTAITVDVIHNQTFCGGAILPGLVALSETYPRISAKLPLVSFQELLDSPLFPAKNTEDAIRSGFYWGTIGAIRQFYEMSFPHKKDVRLILTGGDTDYIFSGLSRVIPARKIKRHELLVLEGINLLCSINRAIGRIAPTVLPHHRTYGSISGGSYEH